TVARQLAVKGDTRSHAGIHEQRGCLLTFQIAARVSRSTEKMQFGQIAHALSVAYTEFSGIADSPYPCNHVNLLPVRRVRTGRFRDNNDDIVMGRLRLRRPSVAWESI